MATAEDLRVGGATQLGLFNDDYASCERGGRGCANDVYAVSLPSQTPSIHVSWFQAQEACANAGKRLPTSAEWQAAADGTPDPRTGDETTDCSIGGLRILTGTRSRCVSARGAFDM